MRRQVWLYCKLESELAAINMVYGGGADRKKKS